MFPNRTPQWKTPEIRLRQAWIVVVTEAPLRIEATRSSILSLTHYEVPLTIGVTVALSFIGVFERRVGSPKSARMSWLWGLLIGSGLVSFAYQVSAYWRLPEQLLIWFF
jgi:hypothetical protein